MDAGAGRRSAGPIAWMVRHRVAPNVLMAFLVGGGILGALFIKKEVFPEYELDLVTVRVSYPGASPEEVEQGIILSVEEAVRGLEGVKEVTSRAGEGGGSVTIEIAAGEDRQRIYQDIQQQVDRIRTFPEDIERPVVSLLASRRQVLSLQVYGKTTEWALRDVAEQVRDRLLQTGRVTVVELDGVRPYEVRIEVREAALRAHGLTLDRIARAIDASSVELPGGGVKTEGGEILLRFAERKDWARQFADIPVLASAGGSVLRLGDIADVRDTFEERDYEETFDGMPTVEIEVFRVGDETPTGVSDAVRAALAEMEPDLPEGVHTAVRYDSAQMYRERLHLLTTDGLAGMVLVLLCLGLFLELRLAMWVSSGIVISFAGALLLLTGTDVSLNMITMFAFIIALGIVVDDAIVIGENIYELRERGVAPEDAAIAGTRDVAVPIGFSILTNIVSFLPLLLLPGSMGKIWSVIPIVVGLVFVVSWVESIFILPSHLAHVSSGSRTRLGGVLHRAQQAFSRLFLRAVERFYGPVVRATLRWRYLTVAGAASLLLLVLAYALSGRMGFVLMPEVESDRAEVVAFLPYGSPVAKAREVRDRLEAAARRVAAEHGGEALCQGIYSSIDDNEVEIDVYLTPPEVRPLSTTEFARLWREAAGTIPGTESQRYDYGGGGPGGGAGVTAELSHRDVRVLDRAGAALAERLSEFPAVKDIDDGYVPGKPQLDFVLTEEGRSLGLTPADVARQVRNAFFGAEAVRQQRGRNEIKVMVRRPEAERVSEYDIERLLIRAPSGRDVPLREIAEVRRGRAYTEIERRAGRRKVTVSANVEPASETNRILASLKDEILPSLARDFPGLTWGFEGRQREMRDALDVMNLGFIAALGAIYVLLAIPFASYVQPLIVMTAVPFGIVGAVLGHLVMGYDLSVISLFGIIALAGVVVKDSLVLVDYANRRRREGMPPQEAIAAACVRRFRPILLTTLTTFVGLAPMIFETSRQARFMIPMAISLAYGILFATAITLILVPALYVIVTPSAEKETAASPLEEAVADRV